MPLTLKIIENTVLKRKPIGSSELPEELKQTVTVNSEYVCSSWLQERGHIKFSLDKDFNFKGFNTWYGFEKHVQVLEDGKVIFPKPKPASIRLNIPYKSQLDNEENPTGSCNVTSLAMCLQFLEAKRKTGVGQFEDELYRYAEDNGLSRHDPHDLAVIVERYGCRDDFRSNATIAQVKEWLTDGKPIVIHGYFTTFGHIVVITGFDSTGFIVHDPYGEWTPYGYRTDRSGQAVHYSYDMIKSLCIPDGSFWVHFISKK